MKSIHSLFACLLLLLLLPIRATAQPAIFTPSDHQTLPVIQGMITFIWDPGTAPSQVRILSPSGDELFCAPVAADMTQASMEINGLLHEGICYTLILESAAGSARARFYISFSAHSSSGSSAAPAGGIGLPQMSSWNLDPASSLLTDAYNRLLNEFFAGKGAGFGHSDRQYVYSTAEHDGALAPGVFIYPDTISGNLGDFDSLLSDIGYMLDLIIETLPTLISGEMGMPDAMPVSSGHSDRFLSPGSVQVKPVYFNQNNRTDAMLCMLLDENNQPIDNRLYLIFRCFIGHQGYLCILDDPMTISDYLACLVQEDGTLPDGLDLSMLLTIPDNASLSPFVVPGLPSVGHPLIDARNDLLLGFPPDSVHAYTGYTIGYREGSASLSPMVIALTDIYSPGKGGYEQLQEDAVTAIMAGIKESVELDRAGPVSYDMAQALLAGEVAFQPLAYALGDTEYLLFVLSQNNQAVDDSFYLISRILSKGGTAHLALFTDQDLIRSFITEQIYTENPPRSFIPMYTEPEETPLGFVYKDSGSANIRQDSSADSPRVGILKAGENARCIGIAENGWYHILLENGVTGYVSNNLVQLRSYTQNGGDSRTAIAQGLEQDVNNALAALLYDPSKASYADAALRTATEADESIVNTISKGIYDTLTAPINTIIAFFQENLGGKLDAKYEQMVDGVLRSIILQASTDETLQNNAFSATDNANETLNLIYSGLGTLSDVMNLPIDSFKDITDNAFYYTNLLYILARENAELDLRYSELAKMAESYMRGYRVLSDIRKTFPQDAVFQHVCDQIQSDLDGYFDEMFKRNALQYAGDSLEKILEDFSESALEYILDNVADKAVSSAFSAALFAGEAGALLTNQSAVISEELDTLLCVQRLRQTVNTYAPNALYTDAAHSIYELKAATDLYALDESRKYFDAYGHTVSGAFNTLLGRYDNEKTLSHIDSQIQEIIETRDALRQSASIVGNLNVSP